MQQLLNGLFIGSIYALFAIGFTLVFGILDRLNLAHPPSSRCRRSSASSSWRTGPVDLAGAADRARRRSGCSASSSSGSPSGR